MGKLKSESFKKCVSLLREFIDDSTLEGNKKESAILALEQLRKITAGSDSPGGGTPPILGPVCSSQPKAYG